VRLAELEIQDNATGSPQIIPLSGFGALSAPPSVSVSFSPIPLAFPQGVAIGSSATESFNITNTGSENVVFTKFHLGGKSAAEYGIQSNNCPVSPAPLAPNSYCQVLLVFTPTAMGVQMADIVVTDDASGSPQSMGIVGKGVAAVKTLSVSPASVIFNPTTVGDTDYDGGEVNVANTGTAPVAFNSFAIDGANAPDFAVSFNTCLNTGAPVLNPGASCTIFLNFTPSATGARNGQLTITSDAANSPQSVSLSGVGQ
jgi:hypothetical protein